MWSPEINGPPDSTETPRISQEPGPAARFQRADERLVRRESVPVRSPRLMKGGDVETESCSKIRAVLRIVHRAVVRRRDPRRINRLDAGENSRDISLTHEPAVLDIP